MIIVDTRESRLAKNPRCSKEPFSIGTLQIGDFDINNQIRLERKTYADLYSSIQSGRYHEQRNKLLQLDEIPYKGFIIEKSELYRSEHRKIVYGAIQNLIIQHRTFFIFQTNSEEETLDLLLDLEKKLVKGDFQKVVENSKATLTNPQTRSKLKEGACAFIRQLVCTKGVSVDIAKTIAQRYVNGSTLVKAFDSCTLNPELLLQDLQRDDQNKRKFGPALSKAIYKDWISID